MYFMLHKDFYFHLTDLHQTGACIIAQDFHSLNLSRFCVIFGE